MKQSIDLTERGDFQKRQTKSPQKLYTHKTVPWNTMNDMFAKPNEDTKGNEHFYYANIDISNNAVLNYMTTTNSNVNCKYFFTKSDSKILNDHESLSTVYKNHIVTTKPQKSKTTIKRNKCNCGKYYTILPWSDILWCRDCKENKKKNNFRKKSELFMKDFNQRYGACIKSNSMKKRKYPKRYKMWYDSDYDVYESSIRQNKNDIIYSKNKSKHLFFRAQEWQPNGRIRQDYDQMFDSADWRNLLRKRIGKLEDLPTLKKKETSYINNSYTFHTFSNVMISDTVTSYTNLYDISYTITTVLTP